MGEGIQDFLMIGRRIKLKSFIKILRGTQEESIPERFITFLTTEENIHEKIQKTENEGAKKGQNTENSINLRLQVNNNKEAGSKDILDLAEEEWNSPEKNELLYLYILLGGFYRSQSRTLG